MKSCDVTKLRLVMSYSKKNKISIVEIGNNFFYLLHYTKTLVTNFIFFFIESYAAGTLKSTITDN